MSWLLVVFLMQPAPDLCVRSHSLTKGALAPCEGLLVPAAEAVAKIKKCALAEETASKKLVLVRAGCEAREQALTLTVQELIARADIEDVEDVEEVAAAKPSGWATSTLVIVLLGGLVGGYLLGR